MKKSTKKGKFTTREDFFQSEITKDSAYVMRSRPDMHGHKPIVPLSAADYQRMVDFERYKFELAGVRAGDRCAIIFDGQLNHEIPMVQALMYLKTTYIILDGDEDEICHDIIKYKISMIFTYPRFLRKILDYVASNALESNLRVVMTGGEKIPDIHQLRQKVFSLLHSTLFDSIGTRELCTFSIMCRNFDYYHFIDKQQIVEIIDPKTLKPALEGELVVTPLWRKDFPIHQMKTGDWIELKKRKKCRCKVKGKFVFDGIARRIEEIKVGSFWVKPLQVYDAAKQSLLSQYSIDRRLWLFFSPPDIILFLTYFGSNKTLLTERLVVLIERKKFLLSLRRRSVVEHKIYELTSAYPEIILADDEDVASIAR